MEVHILDVIKVSGHDYTLQGDIGTVIKKLGDKIIVCIHNAYGKNESHVLRFNIEHVEEIIHTTFRY